MTDAAGHPVPLAEPACSQAVAPTLADTLMTGLSKDDQAGGTSAAAAGQMGWTRPTAAKTGTTETSESGAFVAATPQVAGSVITFDDSSSPKPICDGSPPTSCSTGNLFGGNVPARSFYQAVNGILGTAPVVPLPPTDPQYVTGGPRLQVPDEVSRTVAEAAGTLQQDGFVVTTRSVDSRAPAGTVVGENPLGNGVAGQAITLQASSGRVPPPPPPPSR